MDNFKYAVSFLHTSTDFLHDLEEIVTLSSNISAQFNLPCHKFNLTTRGSSSKTKSYKLTENNLAKLKLSNPLKLGSISFVRFKTVVTSLDTELTIYFSSSPTGSGDFPSNTIVQIDGQALNRLFNIHDLTEVMSQLCKSNKDFDNGFVLCMDTKKLPLLYLSGMSTPGVTEEEKESVYAFSLNINQYKTKIWDIFWMNVINKRLITADMLKQVTKIVSERNVIETGDKYIISLPVDPYEYMAYSRKTQSLKSKLRKIFREKDLIMYK